jgi:hypothetical protein
MTSQVTSTMMQRLAEIATQPTLAMELITTTLLTMQLKRPVAAIAHRAAGTART